MTSVVGHLSRKGQARLYAWLGLAVASLVGAGLFAALVALGRTPGIQDLLPAGDYFRWALVGHVNLAVVIWFLAFQGALWTLADGGQRATPAWVGFGAAAAGAATLVLPAFMGWGQPILSNYVPVLTHRAFGAGLLLFAAGIGLAAAHTVRTVLVRPRPWSLLATGGAVTAGLVLIALLCFALAVARLPVDAPPSVAFEKLAWGGGHVLQFANTAGMVLTWLLLARLTLGADGLPRILDDRRAKRLLAAYLAIALPAPFFYISEAPEGLFTLLMAVGLGPVTGTVGLILLWAVAARLRGGRGAKEGALPDASLSRDPGFSGLVFSIGLFGLGGALALGIRGSNVVIPAHYHAVIGAVTVAFMGLAYHLLPLVGRAIWSERLARVQPSLYGFGQTLFVLGLFWAGSHGVPRKTFGAAQGLHDPSQIAGMGLMGLGGLVAILGGIAFIVNMAGALLGPSGARPVFTPAPVAFGSDSRRTHDDPV